MKKVTAIIEKAADGQYSCYVPEMIGGYGLAGYGGTAREAMDDLQTSLAEVCEMEAAEGRSVPAIEFEYKYDMQSFFNRFDYLNITKIGERAGINSTLLRRYACGAAKAGQKQYDKLRKVVEDCIADLQKATF